MTTPRVTTALWIVSAGLVIAALTGIPALIENRSVGDVVVVVGFAVAIAGGVSYSPLSVAGAKRCPAGARRTSPT